MKPEKADHFEMSNRNAGFNDPHQFSFDDGRNSRINLGDSLDLEIEKQGPASLRTGLKQTSRILEKNQNYGTIQINSVPRMPIAQV